MRRFWLGRIAAAVLFVSCLYACDKDATPAGSSSGANGDGGESSSSSSGASSSSSGDGAASGSSGKPPAERFTTETTETMQFGGRTRQYILGKPKNYDAGKAYPVVMSFHGDGGNGAGQAAGLPFDPVSKSDAILVYPDGADGDWDLYNALDVNKDMNWIKPLIDEIGTKVNIDKTRVFGWGYSKGAYFLAQITCQLGGIFKAISSNAGGGPNDEFKSLGWAGGPGQQANECYVCPAGPIPAIIIHGDQDDPGGGNFTSICKADTNGCSSSRSASTPTPCEVHDGCPAEAPVKWCLIPGFGHGVWNQAIAESWKFFSAL